MIAAAEWFVRLLTLYAALGVAFGVLFVLAGVHRIDPAARGAGAAFRFIILPGVFALAVVVSSRRRSSSTCTGASCRSWPRPVRCPGDLEERSAPDSGSAPVAGGLTQRAPRHLDGTVLRPDLRRRGGASRNAAGRLLSLAGLVGYSFLFALIWFDSDDLVQRRSFCCRASSRR
jgi:hypothetical protein